MISIKRLFTKIVNSQVCLKVCFRLTKRFKIDSDYLDLKNWRVTNQYEWINFLEKSNFPKIVSSKSDNVVFFYEQYLCITSNENIKFVYNEFTHQGSVKFRYEPIKLYSKWKTFLLRQSLLYLCFQLKKLS